VPIQEAAGVRFAPAPPDVSLILGVRPEDVALFRSPEAGTLPAEVYVVEPLGSENIINLRIAGQIVKARTAPTFPATAGEVLHVRIDQTRAHLFRAEGGESLTAGGQ